MAGHGGTRKGAGRPAYFKTAKQNYLVLEDLETGQRTLYVVAEVKNDHLTVKNKDGGFTLRHIKEGDIELK